MEGAQVHELSNEGTVQRLDVFLCERLPGHSRAFFQRLIEEGQVTVLPATKEIKASLKVPPGAQVRLVIPPPRKVDLTPHDIPLSVLFEDEHLAVIDKPAGLSVHPAPDQATPTLVNVLLHKLRSLSSIGGEERPGIVHRLDKDTSGVLVVAKNDFAHNFLSLQFKERTVAKTYLAVVRGEPTHMSGTVNLPLGKSYTHAKKQMVRDDGTGREAITEYTILRKLRGYALAECRPHSGRTHQIRVHLASLRLPVACDSLYGREKRICLGDLTGSARDSLEPPILERQALHAASLSFHHPITHERLTFSAPLHADMERLLTALYAHRSQPPQQ